MKMLYRIAGALAVLAMFAYLAYTMYAFDQLTGRQYRFVILIASFMVGILGKTVAAVATAVLGMVAAGLIVLDKDDDDKNKIAITRRL